MANLIINIAPHVCSPTVAEVGRRPNMKRIVFCAVASLSFWAPMSPTPLIAAPSSLPSASPETNASKLGIDINDLCRHWVHSSEEEKTGEKDQIFRPAAFKEFPPSRFRMAYKFARNGDCEWFFLSPDDAHHFKAGKWMLDASDKTLLRITANGTTKSYRIAALSNRLLRLTSLESKPNK